MKCCNSYNIDNTELYGTNFAFSLLVYLTKNEKKNVGTDCGVKQKQHKKLTKATSKLLSL